MFFSGGGLPERTKGGVLTNVTPDIPGKDNVCITVVPVYGPTDAAEALLQEGDRYLRSLHFLCLFIFMEIFSQQFLMHFEI